MRTGLWRILVRPLEKLHGTLVLFSRRSRLKRSQVFTPSRFGVLLARIEPVVAAFEFANHSTVIRQHLNCRRRFPLMPP